VTLKAREYKYEWFNPDNGETAVADTTQTKGGKHTFRPPFSGDAVLYIALVGQSKSGR
jgi:hypothetical protein